MAGLVPAIHDFFRLNQGMDGRDKRGHDGEVSQNGPDQL
jgi:hypothetical protein